MNEVPEPLARFVTESGKMKRSAVRPNLFKPDRDLVLSVFRIKNLEFPAVKKLGTEVVRRHANARRLYGGGKLSSSVVHEVGLKLVNDDNPPLHSSIEGWPEATTHYAVFGETLPLAEGALLISTEEPIT